MVNRLIRYIINLLQEEINRPYIKASVIENQTKISPNCRIINSHIGKGTYLSENCKIDNVKIGKFCSIGPNLIAGWGIHPTKTVSTHPYFYSNKAQNGYKILDKSQFEERRPIKIGNDVFIGANVFVSDGTIIGDGAVIGAGTVVTKDVGNYEIVVGSPMRCIKKRFEEYYIEEMLKIKWWDWPDDELLNVQKYLFEVGTFVEKYKTDIPLTK